MKIIITRQELKAALIFASTDESRMTLNGVRIEVTPERETPMLVACDGRRLVAIESVAVQPELPTEEHAITLDPEFANIIVNLSKACGGKISSWIELENNPGSKRLVATIVGKDVYLDVHAGALIEGTYPEWRKVLPPKSKQREPISDIGLNAELVGDFAKAAKVLECLPVVQMNLVGKEKCVEVRLTACEQFYGLVMQCKLDDSIEYQPEFLKIVEGFSKEEEAPKPSKITPIESAEAPSDELDEDLVQQCVEIIRSEQKASVQLLQRRLRLGYPRALQIMDELQNRGIVRPAKGADPRDIRIDLESPKAA